MSHQGGLLVLPSGMRAWAPLTLADVSAADLEPFIAEKAEIDFLLFGMGDTMQRLPALLLAVLKSAGLHHEAMATAAAIHVYNVVVSEGRRVAAAFLPVTGGHG